MSGEPYPDPPSVAPAPAMQQPPAIVVDRPAEAAAAAAAELEATDAGSPPSAWQLFLQSASGRAGLLLFAVMLILSAWVLITYPRDFGSARWSNPAYWANNPRSAPPVWAARFSGRAAVPHTVLELSQPAETRTIPAGEIRLYQAPIDYTAEEAPGHLWVWTDRTVWNPVGGFGDVYSGDIYQNLVDAPIVSHPFSGLPIPFRASFETETAGPDGALEVPEDALMWDAAADAWTPVGAGVTAVSKVTYDYNKYFQAPFHHGQPITPADLFYSIAQSWETSYDENRVQIETALAITSRPFLETFKGFRLLDDDRVESYVDFWHFEPDYIASYAATGSLATPWELLYAMDQVVFEQRRGAYSDTTAARFNVPWLSLVAETDARLVVRTLQDLLDNGTFPEAMLNLNGRALVTLEEAKARYQAAMDWFDETNLLVISNGPFYLTRYDPPAQFAQVDAFRAEGYPFKPGDWEFGEPPVLTVTIEAPPPAILGDAISVPVTVEGPGELSVRYALVDPSAADPANTIVASGEASGSDGSFTIEIGADVTAMLFPSIYQLYVLGVSDQLARVAERAVDLPIGV